MAYVGPFAIMMIVLSPLLVPIAVTTIHAIAHWQTHFARLRGAIRQRIRTVYQPLSRRLRVPGVQRRETGEWAVNTAAGSDW
jgi:hypothetical protein